MIINFLWREQKQPEYFRVQHYEVRQRVFLESYECPRQKTAVTALLFQSPWQPQESVAHTLNPQWLLYLTTLISSPGQPGGQGGQAGSGGYTAHLHQRAIQQRFTSNAKEKSWLLSRNDESGYEKVFNTFACPCDVSIYHNEFIFMQA